MILSELHLHNFRNYEDLTVHFAPGVNVLIGHNAHDLDPDVGGSRTTVLPL